MLRAVIFDFNGVLVDDEPIHLEMFQRVLGEEGLSLDAQDYYSRYLGMDDRDCFKAVYQRHERTLSDAFLEQLIQRKAHYYRQSIENRIMVFPGVKKLIPQLALRLPLAIASGALRSEIEMILERIGLRNHFQVIVSTEDVSEGKPNPEIFIKTLSLLNQRGLEGSIEPSQCLVVEDSKEGIRAAHHARIKCLAVTNSHRAEDLAEAEAVVNSLEEVSLNFLEKFLASPDKPA